MMGLLHELILNKAHYDRVVDVEIPKAKRFLWIATADIKDVHVEGPRGRYIPFLSVLADLVQDGVDVRLIHAKEPGPAFRKDFDRFPALVESDRFERILCVRMHMKVIIIDGLLAYVGSANLTGAGIGAKSPKRRNFEAGILTDDADTIAQLMDELDELYLGRHCGDCGRREYCPDPIV
jgi:phosphatidylserine/phosphatidylglycerophosphate/cardiolipin synthase-like enzyme